MTSYTSETGERPLTDFLVADATLSTRQGLENSITQVNINSRPTINLDPSRDRHYNRDSLEPMIEYLKKAGYRVMGSLHDAVRNKVLLVEKQESKRLAAAKWFSSAERFSGEKNAQELLRRYGGHKNILLADTFIDEWQIMILPHAAGGNLRLLQSIAGTLTLPQVQVIAVDVLDALQYLHERNFTHRDIKDTNIVLDLGVGGLKTYQLIDYEFVRHPELAIPEEERECTIVGTVHYIAPEIWKGKNTDHRSDLYATGITLYHALTGKFPFDGLTHCEIMQKHLEEPVPDIRQHNPEMTPVIKWFFEMALAKDPDERYQSAAELKKAFTKAALRRHK